MATIKPVSMTQVVADNKMFMTVLDSNGNMWMRTWERDYIIHNDPDGTNYTQEAVWNDRGWKQLDLPEAPAA